MRKMDIRMFVTIVYGIFCNTLSQVLFHFSWSLQKMCHNTGGETNLALTMQYFNYLEHCSSKKNIFGYNHGASNVPSTGLIYKFTEVYMNSLSRCFETILRYLEVPAISMFINGRIDAHWYNKRTDHHLKNSPCPFLLFTFTQSPSIHTEFIRPLYNAILILMTIIRFSTVIITIRVPFLKKLKENLKPPINFKPQSSR